MSWRVHVIDLDRSPPPLNPYTFRVDRRLTAVLLVALVLLLGGSTVPPDPDMIRSTWLPALWPALSGGTAQVGACHVLGENARGLLLAEAVEPVGCVTPHTYETYHTGQVPRRLLRSVPSTRRGLDAWFSEVFGVLRADCARTISSYVGGPWQAARLFWTLRFTPHPGGYGYRCDVAEASGPGDVRPVSRTESLRDILRQAPETLAITCLLGNSVNLYVPCDQPHDGEFLGLYPVPATAGPGVDLAFGGCADLMLTYLDLPPGWYRSDVGLLHLHPGVPNEDDQEPVVQCYATTSGPALLNASIRGLALRALPRYTPGAR